MMIQTIHILLFSVCFIFGQYHHGGSVPLSACRDTVEESMFNDSTFDKALVSPNAVLFTDPMGGTGLNGFGQTLINYVDLQPTAAVKDYNCGDVTYNGHRGTDIEILSFYEMDEGVAVLCAAPGEVIYVHDGEFDRRTSWQNGVVANQVTVQHTDGLQSIYLHFRKNSIRVSSGQQVQTGDTLGFIGSSGYSSNPHLHFEVKKNGNSVDPFQGPCQENESMWQRQPAYVTTLPFELMDHGLTTVELDWPTILEKPPVKVSAYRNTLLRSWVRLRNARTTDKFTWKIYRNDGSLFWEYSFYPSGFWSSSWWYVYFTLPETGANMGEWQVDIFCNDSLIANQPFKRVNVPNQKAVLVDTNYAVQKDGQLTGTLKFHDPDGTEIFWYKIAQQPKNGTIRLFAGRNHRFNYTANPGFNGNDTALIYIEDDQLLKGDNGRIVFNVGKSTSIAKSILHENDFSLIGNYPNPFNPQTRILYHLNRNDQVKLEVYDLSGKEIKILFNEQQSAGEHSIVFDASELAAGIYFYRLSTSMHLSQTRKMLILK
ncbi:MAG: peptidoglycan DD-metalloendopeptidase family protein [Calditrichae bacterium]|nr:peptidoglycan DD-metalloendopeptidase family protein [Calditrichota bacterium]MCB9057446.1 peptidoglycan DD-metalloendopeptidase family protein [Calditrichia bacterium]